MCSFFHKPDKRGLLKQTIKREDSNLNWRLHSRTGVKRGFEKNEAEEEKIEIKGKKIASTKLRRASLERKGAAHIHGLGRKRNFIRDRVFRLARSAKKVAWWVQRGDKTSVHLIYEWLKIHLNFLIRFFRS